MRQTLQLQRCQSSLCDHSLLSQPRASALTVLLLRHPCDLRTTQCLAMIQEFAKAKIHPAQPRKIAMVCVILFPAFADNRI